MPTVYLQTVTTGTKEADCLLALKLTLADQKWRAEEVKAVTVATKKEKKGSRTVAPLYRCYCRVGGAVAVAVASSVRLLQDAMLLLLLMLLRDCTETYE